MPTSAGVAPVGATVIIAKPDLGRIIDRLRQEDYTVVGPTIAQGAIVFDELRTVNDLPIGWTDEQEGGHYRLVRRDDEAYFGYAVGPHSWKKYLFPAQLTLFSIETARRVVLGASQSRAGPEVRVPGGPLVRPARDRDPGPNVRARASCRAALQGAARSRLHHRGPLRAGGGDVFLYQHADRSQGGARVRPRADRAPRGAARRGGDRARPGDHERRPLPAGLRRGPGHGSAVVRRDRGTDPPPARDHDLPELLYANLEHPRWDDVADRCLSCTNCTMVCPTCFCHSIDDVPDLEGQRSERVRVWDSCFNPAHAHTAGGNTRPDIRSRYRQWLTHKLASWIDQYGVSGCVGCGRCITWCPVGIDLTEEVAAIRGKTRAMTPLISPQDDPLCPFPAVVRSIEPETPGVRTFRVEFADHERQARYRVEPGQFNMLYLPGIGEVPISVSGGADLGSGIGHTIRFVGRVTRAMEALRPGSMIGIRGPYGSSWPLGQARGRDVVLVAGGLGMAPLRLAVKTLLAERASTAGSSSSTERASRPTFFSRQNTTTGGAAASSCWSPSTGPMPPGTGTWAWCRSCSAGCGSTPGGRSCSPAARRS